MRRFFEAYIFETKVGSPRTTTSEGEEIAELISCGRHIRANGFRCELGPNINMFEDPRRNSNQDSCVFVLRGTLIAFCSR